MNKELQKRFISAFSKIIIICLIFTFYKTQPTNSYFASEITSSNNQFSTGFWQTPTPTPTPEPEATAGAVVINEVMWMGSTGSTADEWIELRNTTNHNIDLSNWRIGHTTSGSEGHLEIPAHYTIPANGYFLIANYDSNHDKSAINNLISVDYSTSSLNLDNNYQNNGSLILKDKNQQVIDATPNPTSSSWPAGYKNDGIYKSMERNDTPGDGTLTSSWHTCTDTVCNDITYWDIEDGNYGTPKAANHSGEPRLEVNLQDNGTISFTVVNISGFNKLRYQLTYDTNSISDGVTGEITLSGQDTYTEGPITLGTCSAGGTCVYYSGISNLKVKIDLEDMDKKILSITS